MKAKILIIDDDIQIGNLEQEVLEKEGYFCLRAYSGTEAAMLLEKERPDIILLDLMLPGMSGEELLKRIAGIPVIVVSAKIGIDDKISMLSEGAVDYITKPFNTRELAARVEVQLRRTTQSFKQKIKCANIEIDMSAHMAFVEGRAVNLTKTEFAILKLLMQNKGQVIAKSVILDRIRDDTLDCTETSLKTHISHLRTKLRDMGGDDCIESIWGIGFKMGENND